MARAEEHTVLFQLDMSTQRWSNVVTLDCQQHCRHNASPDLIIPGCYYYYYQKKTRPYVRFHEGFIEHRLIGKLTLNVFGGIPSAVLAQVMSKFIGYSLHCRRLVADKAAYDESTSNIPQTSLRQVYGFLKHRRQIYDKPDICDKSTTSFMSKCCKLIGWRS